ncbi:MarR family winged helix-turn-helix transcriptional regulator [Homoserinibacter sp. GY 40078]|uniref:MarR family winged helix-turn-helix transcriptional regulator n=1 Tax=Homoserinibacter sp. GY 40078 TaxID=2603275 RepID=UPI00165029E0|nr:MarR family transcriptional regulator [Homoserinibacter sp. GY 40078]
MTDETAGSREAAMRNLEGAFGELMTEFRRAYAQAAERVSPGMLPGTFRVLATIHRHGSVTVSGLAERLISDKGQVSRTVSELEDLGLVIRTPDPNDGRIKLIEITDEGAARLESARIPHNGRLAEVLDDWPVETIERLAGLLHALAVGETPAS